MKCRTGFAYVCLLMSPSKDRAMHGTKDDIFYPWDLSYVVYENNFCVSMQKTIAKNQMGNLVSFPKKDGKAAKSKFRGENKADFE